MLYKRATGDDDWGQFIEIDDTSPIHTSPIHTSPIHTSPIHTRPIYKSNYIPQKKVLSKPETSYMYKWLSETCLIIIEIPRRNTIKHNCICSTIVTVGSIMLCFIVG